MADTATEQQGAAETDQPDQQQDQPQQPETGKQGAQEDKGEGYKGAGSKDALKADLAAERDKRQQLEQSFNQMRDGIAKAFGFDDGKQLTPEQMTEQLQTAQTESAAAKAHLAVFRAAPAGVDADALLDSERFRASLKDISVDDRDSLSKAIEAFVDQNPRFRTTQTGAGARDAGASGGGKPRSMDDWIRGR